jgi:hypothetical protein
MSPLRRNIRQYGPSRTSLGPSKLYLDDIQAIVDALDEFAIEYAKAESAKSGEPITDLDGAKVIIVAGEAVADAVEDLREASQDELGRISIMLDEPRIVVNLRHIASDISFPRENAEARAAADDIARHINRRRMRFTGLWARLGLAIYHVLAIVVNLAFGLYKLMRHQDVFGSIAFTMMDVTLLIFLGGFTHSGNVNPVRVVPLKECEGRRISKRTRRDILVAAVSLAGAAIIAVAGFWAGIFAR